MKKNLFKISLIKKAILLLALIVFIILNNFTILAIIFALLIIISAFNIFYIYKGKTKDKKLIETNYLLNLIFFTLITILLNNNIIIFFEIIFVILNYCFLQFKNNDIKEIQFKNIILILTGIIFFISFKYNLTKILNGLTLTILNLQILSIYYILIKNKERFKFNKNSDLDKTIILNDIKKMN